MKKISSILAICCLFSLASCGGGGGGGAAVPPTARAMITNVIRTFLNGEVIQYSLTGSITALGVNVPLTGTASYAISTNASPPDLLAGTVRSVNTVSMTGAFTGGIPFASTANSYFSQTPSGTMNMYGDSISGWITIPGAGFVPTMVSPIVAPTSWINNYTQQNGDFTSTTVTVVGTATVATGMGVFEAYQVQSSTTTTLAAGGSAVSTQITYIVPSIGPIKIVINMTSTDAFAAVTTSQMTLIASTTNIGF